MLIILVHRGLTLNAILPNLAGMKYPTPIDVSLGYDNLILDEMSSYLTIFSCPFGRYQYIRLLFGEATAGDIFQKKIITLFSSMPMVFGIADDILIAGFDA